MTEPLKRDEIVALLERLGGDDDADVLTAAHALHAAVTDAGIGWNELLAGADPGEAGTADTAADQPATAPAPGDGGGALVLIDKLLARPGITEDFRREMEGYRSDIAQDAFTDDDHRYLLALDKRLSGKG